MSRRRLASTAARRSARSSTSRAGRGSSSRRACSAVNSSCPWSAVGRLLLALRERFHSCPQLLQLLAVGCPSRRAARPDRRAVRRPLRPGGAALSARVARSALASTAARRSTSSSGGLRGRKLLEPCLQRLRSPRDRGRPPPSAPDALPAAPGRRAPRRASGLLRPSRRAARRARPGARRTRPQGGGAPRARDARARSPRARPASPPAHPPWRRPRRARPAVPAIPRPRHATASTRRRPPASRRAPRARRPPTERPPDPQLLLQRGDFLAPRGPGGTCASSALTRSMMPSTAEPDDRQLLQTGLQGRRSRPATVRRPAASSGREPLAPGRQRPPGRTTRARPGAAAGPRSRRATVSPRRAASSAPGARPDVRRRQPDAASCVQASPRSAETSSRHGAAVLAASRAASRSARPSVRGRPTVSSSRRVLQARTPRRAMALQCPPPPRPQAARPAVGGGAGRCQLVEPRLQPGQLVAPRRRRARRLERHRAVRRARPPRRRAGDSSSRASRAAISACSCGPTAETRRPRRSAPAPRPASRAPHQARVERPSPPRRAARRPPEAGRELAGDALEIVA